MTVSVARKLAAAALLVASLAACGSSSSSSESTTPVTVFSLSADPGLNLPAAARGKARLTTAALRSDLDTVLAQHAQLVAALMHQVGAGNDNPTAAVDALAANTKALTNAISLIYGPEGGRAFAQLWEQHTQFFIDYAYADRVRSGNAKQLAERRLLDYQNDFASFVSSATAGRAPLLAVTGLLHSHVHDLTSYIDADVAGHGDEAKQLLDRAVAHMHDIARAITDAIAAQHLKTIAP
jgi:hypothetical protein